MGEYEKMKNVPMEEDRVKTRRMLKRLIKGKTIGMDVNTK